MTFNLFTTRFSVFCTIMALSLTGGSISPDKVQVNKAISENVFQTQC